MTFPVWNGQDTNGVAVDGNRQLRRDFTPIYSRDGDGSLVADIDKQIVVGRVDAVDEVAGELQVHVRGVDGVIPEDLILSTRKV